MKSKEFSRIRHYLGKNQKQLARMLCVSTRAIQSFEQGWRSIPPAAERQLLLLLSLKRSLDKNTKPCWEVLNCPAEWRDNCTAWEFKNGYICWFISGTFCQGEYQDSWDKKIKLCQQCEIFLSMIPRLL